MTSTVLSALLSLAMANDNLTQYLRNEKALKALEQNQFDQATRELGAAQSEDPDDPRLTYNEGVVRAKQNDWQRAGELFVRGADQAGVARPGVAALNHYNAAVAYEALKKFPEAIQQAVAGIEKAELAQSPDLEQMLRRKLAELIQKQQEQQQKQKQDQNEKKENQDQKDQDQKGDSDNKDQSKQDDSSKNKGQEKDSQQQPQSIMRREFKSDKLSKEDAEKVMDELMNREKDLRKRLQRFKGQKQGSNKKDW